MIKKKLKLYYRITVQNLFKILYGKILIPKKKSNFTKKIKINNSKYKTFNNNNYHIYNIKNARIYTDKNENVAIIKNNYILENISFQQVNGKLKKIKYNSVTHQGTPSFLKKFPGKVFNLSQGGSGNNYFHFIFDILPKLYLLKLKIDLKKIDYFYVSEPKDWQINIFKKFGIKEEKLLSSDKYKHIMADEIYAVEHPWYHKGYIHLEVSKLPKWIIFNHRKFFKSSSKNKFNKKKIFLDRSQSIYKHCQIENFGVIKNLAIKKRFDIKRPEIFTFDKQIQLFRNSHIILGAHGAAFANIIFCKPGTKIIEIIPKDHPNKKCARISKILKLRYFRIETEPDNSDVNYPHKIKLNKKNLEKINKIIDL